MIFSLRRPQYFNSHTTSQWSPVALHWLSSGKVIVHSTLVTWDFDAWDARFGYSKMASNQSVLNALRICELRMSVRGILCYLAITLDSAEIALKYYLRQGSEYEVILLSCRNISLWFAAILLDASTRNSLWELKYPAADDSYKFIIFASSWRRFCFAVSWLHFSVS